MSAERTPHPIRLHNADDLRRSRLTVFFRLLLAIPHIIWSYLWGYVAFAVGALTWVCALVVGRPPRPFHRFLGAYVRYQTHLTAFVFLVANPFPGFVGARGSYPIDVETPVEPQRQHRLVTLVRVILVLPAAVISYALGSAMIICSFFGWWVSLIRGRMPDGMRDLGAFAIRYQAQVNAYVFFQTARYPSASPRAEFEPAPVAPAAAADPGVATT